MNEAVKAVKSLREEINVEQELRELDKPIISQLIKDVEQWSIDKGLDKSNSFAQMNKSIEEFGEVAGGLARGNKELIEDGIGDVVVTLIILAQQQGMSLEQCLQTAYDEIKGRTGKMVDGTFIKSEDL